MFIINKIRDIKSLSKKTQKHVGVHSGGSRNFKTGGGSLFRFRICFDAPSDIPYVFVARVVNKVHNVNIVY